MDNAIAEKFCSEFNLTQEQIKVYESFYEKTILPAINRHYLFHLVTTIEELINEKQKHEFLKVIREVIDKEGAGYDYTMLEKTINRKMLRLFSIILVPIESGKLKARTHLIKGGCGVLITYWKQLPKDQIRILIAHELGHVANRYFFNNENAASEDGLASLFGYIALQDRNDFYLNKTEPFTRKYDMQIYNEMVNISNRKHM